MSQDPISDYEAPSVEEVDTKDAPAVTAAGIDCPISDLRAKHLLRPLDGSLLEPEL